MVTDAEFYQAHLDRVSRSFAFCIRQLHEPLRGWVALSYLLCRILDTIEDSAWTSREEQFSAFAKFDGALASADQVNCLNGWAAQFPESVNAHERSLLADAEVIFQDLHNLPQNVREVIVELVQSMSLGMQHFAKQNDVGRLKLQTLGEVNQYCFFVAGLVGELLSKLIAKVEPRFVLSQMNLLRAHHFGLFLQKVNLLKDQPGDEKQGRHLIPSRQLVEDSARENADHAFEFLLALPNEQLEFRRFCAWSLFLGLEAVYAARDGLKQNKIFKVSREKTSEILAAVENALSNDGEIRSLFATAREKLGWNLKPTGQVRAVRLPEWLLRFYRGRLKPEGLMELGVASI